MVIYGSYFNTIKEIYNWPIVNTMLNLGKNNFTATKNKARLFILFIVVQCSSQSLRLVRQEMEIKVLKVGKEEVNISF